MSDFKLTDDLKNEIKKELREEIKKELAQELREEILKELEAEKQAADIKTEAEKAPEVKEEKPVEAAEKETEKAPEVKEEKPVEAAEKEAEKAPEVKEEKPVENAEKEAEKTLEVKEEKPVEAAEKEAEKAPEVKEEKPVENAEKEAEKQPEVKEEAGAESDNKSDKKITFKKGLIVYVIIWIIITLLVCIYLWKSMSGYQKNYDEAKAKANPDIVAMQCLNNFKMDSVADIAKVQYPEVSPYESDNSWQVFYKSLYDEKSLSFNRVENFSETNPEYEVTAGDVKVGKFKLTETGDADKYGFHNYALKSKELVAGEPVLKTYKIKVLKGNEVIVNGVKISETETPVCEKVSDSVHDEIAEKTGKSFETAEYVLTGFLETPEVSIVDNGNEFPVEVKEDEFKYYASYDVNFLNDLQDRIITADKSYIQVMNSVSQFGVVAGYLVPYGDAYQAILSAMNGLAWAGAPEEFEIRNSEIKEMWQYDDDNFVVVTHHAIHRVYRGETYDEEMTIENLYTNRDGVWLIKNMALKR